MPRVLLPLSRRSPLETQATGHAASGARAAAAPAREAQARWAGSIASSPRMAAQRQRVNAAFGPRPVLQRVVTSATAGGAAATLTNAALTQWITGNMSPRVQGIAQHADINLHVIWDGALGNPASTNMSIRWADNVAGAQGPLDLFTAGNAGAVGAINFDNLTGYDIDLPIRMQTPQVAPATWRGTLTHELEAHTGLAHTTSQAIDQAWNDRNKRPNFGTKITTTMTARDDVAEHRNWAEGGGGSEDSMTRAVGSAPRNEKVDVIVDIAGDRIQEAQGNWPVLAPDTHRQKFNTAMGNIRRWLRVMKAALHHPAATGPEQGRIDAEITNAANR